MFTQQPKHTCTLMYLHVVAPSPDHMVALVFHMFILILCSVAYTPSPRVDCHTYTDSHTFAYLIPACTNTLAHTCTD